MGRHNGIRLSEKYGLNPAMVKCERCGHDTGEIALLGRMLHYRCRSCQVLIIGKRPKECPHCKTGRSFESLGEFDGSVGIKRGFCDDCEVEIAEHEAMVAEGGIFWKCRACRREGVIKPGNSYANAVRRQTGIEAPEPVGVEFSGDHPCPVCLEQKGGDGDEQ